MWVWEAIKYYLALAFINVCCLFSSLMRYKKNCAEAMIGVGSMILELTGPTLQEGEFQQIDSLTTTALRHLCDAETVEEVDTITHIWWMKMEPWRARVIVDREEESVRSQQDNPEEGR